MKTSLLTLGLGLIIFISANATNYSCPNSEWINVDEGVWSFDFRPIATGKWEGASTEPVSGDFKPGHVSQIRLEEENGLLKFTCIYTGKPETKTASGYLSVLFPNTVHDWKTPKPLPMVVLCEQNATCSVQITEVKK